MPSVVERAFHIWPMLVLAAKNRQVLTYDQVTDCTGMFTGGLGSCLEPIQSYCLQQGFPPLTLLVVSSKTGLPGFGFSGVSIQTPEDFAQTLQTVFAFDWSRKAPDVQTLAQAAADLPSNASRN